MIAFPTAVNVPLKTDDYGVIRIANTRVSLDSVVYSFRQGATPETIIDQFPTLSLADVYLVLGYYLQNREEVALYIQNQETQADQIQHEIEKKFPPEGIRERLLARLKTKQDS